MSMCVECLRRENPEWMKRYRRGSMLLVLYCAAVFLLPDSLAALVLQGLFFVVAFPWIVWPLIAASRPNNLR